MEECTNDVVLNSCIPWLDFLTCVYVIVELFLIFFSSYCVMLPRVSLASGSYVCGASFVDISQTHTLALQYSVQY